jgi:hypothetical protein
MKIVYQVKRAGIGVCGEEKEEFSHSHGYFNGL